MAVISEIGQCLNLHQPGEEAGRWRMKGQCSPERQAGKENPAKDITELQEGAGKVGLGSVWTSARHGTIR